MPWSETTVMDEKISLISDWCSGVYTISELARAYGVTRPTVYKYIERYEEEGFEGLEEYGRAPQIHPNATPEKTVMRILKLKTRYKWGAKKIHTLMEERYKSEEIPSISTIDRILKRNGMVKSRRRIRRVEPVYPKFDPEACNIIWSGDFKGKFRMGNNVYCHPLTIADSFSRFVFSAKGMYGERLEPTQQEFRRVFLEYGMPLQIHTDNGQPFGCVQAIGRLTRLAVWFLEHGVEPVYSDPASPSQNGRHERMHRDLKGDATRPAGYDLKTQQRKLNDFVHKYNYVRPHESLGMKTPASVHTWSEREYKDKVRDWDYPPECIVRRVCLNGAIRWKSVNWLVVSTALKDKHVGLEEIGDGIYKVYFRQKMLGYFHEDKMRIMDEMDRIKKNNV